MTFFEHKNSVSALLRGIDTKVVSHKRIKMQHFAMHQMEVAVQNFREVLSLVLLSLSMSMSISNDEETDGRR